MFLSDEIYFALFSFHVTLNFFLQKPSATSFVLISHVKLLLSVTSNLSQWPYLLMKVRYRSLWFTSLIMWTATKHLLDTFFGRKFGLDTNFWLPLEFVKGLTCILFLTFSIVLVYTLVSNTLVSNCSHFFLLYFYSGYTFLAPEII